MNKFRHWTDKHSHTPNGPFGASPWCSSFHFHVCFATTTCSDHVQRPLFITSPSPLKMFALCSAEASLLLSTKKMMENLCTNCKLQHHITTCVFYTLLLCVWFHIFSSRETMKKCEAQKCPPYRITILFTLIMEHSCTLLCWRKRLSMYHFSSCLLNVFICRSNKNFFHSSENPRTWFNT